MDDLKRQNPKSFLDCLRDGWFIYKKNIMLVLTACVLLFAAEHMRQLSLYWAGAALGGGYSSFAFDFLLQLIVGFLTFCVTSLLVSKSLLLLQQKNASIQSAYKVIQPKTIVLVKTWLAVYLLTLIPTFLEKLWGLMDPSAFYEQNSWVIIAIGIAAIIFVPLLLVLLGLLWAISNYFVCVILCGDSSGVLGKSLLTAKRTYKKLILLFSLYIGALLALGIPTVMLNDRGYPAQVVYGVLGTAITFLQVVIATVIYFHAPQQSSDVETDDTVPDIEIEPASEENFVEPFHFRVEPSLNFDEVGEFHCGLARVRQPKTFGTGKWGYADIDGRLVLPFVYSEAGDFDDGIAVVKKGRYAYFINRSGQPVMDAAYDQASKFKDDLAVVRVNFDWAVINREGAAKTLPYDEVFSFNEGLAVAYDGENWLYLDTTLSPVLSVAYDDVWSFYDGLSMVEKDAKLGFIDTSGKEVVPLRYDEALSFCEGYAAVMMRIDDEDRWGYIDGNGNEVIALQFERAGSFSNGRAAVCLAGIYGHINTAGEFCTLPEYEAVGSFSNGFAVVKDTDYGYVDENGNGYIMAGYLDARPFRENLAWVKTIDGWGILEIEAHLKP